MPTFNFEEPGRPQFFGGYMVPDVPAPNPITSPVVFNTPGVYPVRVPLDVTSITVEGWGGGASGVGGKAADANGKAGGGAGGYMKATIEAPFYGPGSLFTVTVGAGGAQSAPAGTSSAGGATSIKTEGQTAFTADGAVGAFGGGNLVTPHDGVNIVTDETGGNAADPVGKVGGKGGDAPGTGGGVGGAGGADTLPGKAGAVPGAGGGGGGADADTTGGAGADGKFVISWT